MSVNGMSVDRHHDWHGRGRLYVPDSTVHFYDSIQLKKNEWGRGETKKNERTEWNWNKYSQLEGSGVG